MKSGGGIKLHILGRTFRSILSTTLKLSNKHFKTSKKQRVKINDR